MDSLQWWASAHAWNSHPGLPYLCIHRWPHAPHPNSIIVASFYYKGSKLSKVLNIRILSNNQKIVHTPWKQWLWDQCILAIKKSINVRVLIVSLQEEKMFYLLIKSAGKACSSKRQSFLYAPELICIAYWWGVKVFSMIPPALIRAFRAAAFMSSVPLRCGTRAWCNGCKGLSCRWVAITIGSTVACVLSLHRMLRIKSMVKLFKRIELTTSCVFSGSKLV